MELNQEIKNKAETVSATKTCISVIVPIYNVEKQLRRCLDSLVNQTLKDIEIVCVNDGSTDSSGKILEEYANRDKRIKVIYQDNQGLSGARNSGIKIAQGEYTAFIDSDDYVDLDYLEKLYNAAVKYGADISGASIYMVAPHRSRYLFKINSVKKSKKPKDKFKFYKLPNFNYVYNKIYRTKLIQVPEMKFLANKYYEDIFFTYKILYYSGVAVTVPNTRYYYCVNSESITGIPNEKKEKDWEEASLKLQKFVQDKNILSGIGKHWIYKIVYEIKLFNIPIWSVLKFGMYYQYKLLGLPLFTKRMNYLEGE